MAIKNSRPTTPSRRYYSVLSFKDLADARPLKSLTVGKRRKGGHSTQTGGCGCRTAGTSDSRAPYALWLTVPLVFALRRRRRADRSRAQYA